jgi:hypothetical protein
MLPCKHSATCHNSEAKYTCIIWTVHPLASHVACVTGGQHDRKEHLQEIGVDGKKLSNGREWSVNWYCTTCIVAESTGELCDNNSSSSRLSSSFKAGEFLQSRPTVDFSRTKLLHKGKYSSSVEIRKSIILQNRLLLIRKGVSACLYTVIMVTNDQHSYLGCILKSWKLWCEQICSWVISRYNNTKRWIRGGTAFHECGVQ